MVITDLKRTGIAAHQACRVAVDIALNSGAVLPGELRGDGPCDRKAACEDNHLIFIGPNSEILRLTGNKPEAKKLAATLGIPVLVSREIDPIEDSTWENLVFPLIIKASAGGGGKGMKIVHRLEELQTEAIRSSGIALRYFGNKAIFAEQFVIHARHVEIQILGDQFGGVIHLYERECSIQRNHQKILEEAPALSFAPALLANLYDAALKIGRAVGFKGAGTVEFLIDPSGNYFFMEMNPRIQVEHGVTEMITGVDIVREQLLIASGHPLSFSQDQILPKGHAIETRIYAENPSMDFSPSSEPLLFVNLPVHPHLRVEADLVPGQKESNQFDPLLLKLIAWGEDRENAIRLMKDQISALNIIGPEHNVNYLENILSHPAFGQNNFSVDFCQTHHEKLIRQEKGSSSLTDLPFLLGFALSRRYLKITTSSTNNPWDYYGYWRLTTPLLPVSVNGRIHRVQFDSKELSSLSFLWDGKQIFFTVGESSESWSEITIGNKSKKIFYVTNSLGELRCSCDNINYQIAYPGLLQSYSNEQFDTNHLPGNTNGEITSHLHGKILEIYVNENQFIKKGDPLLVIESMKSENRILAHKDAKIRRIAVKVGGQVTDRMPLLFLED